MNKLLIPIVTLAMMIVPAAAHAEQCRDSATGKFAKCGAPGAVPASQYVAKGKMKAKSKPAMASTMTMPAATPTKSAKPGLMSMFKPKPKPKPKPTSAARCKDAKSKFVKCGTPGAKPV